MNKCNGTSRIAGTGGATCKGETAMTNELTETAASNVNTRTSGTIGTTGTVWCNWTAARSGTIGTMETANIHRVHWSKWNNLDQRNCFVEPEHRNKYEYSDQRNVNVKRVR